jgi:biotin carboxyl carrier protein
MDTELIDREWSPAGDEVPPAAWPAASAALAATGRQVQPLVGFRLNQPAQVRIDVDDEQRLVAVRTTTEYRWVAAVEGVVLDIDGRMVRARLAAAPTPEAALRHAAHTGGAALVKAPMPGKVLEVRIARGDEVVAGQVLLVLEAMKMENTVSAPAAGRVDSVLVRPGQQVQRGEALVELA